jgi:glutamine synthetase adenylyltransferase
MAAAEIRIIHVHRVVLDEDTRRLLERIDHRVGRVIEELHITRTEEEQHMGEIDQKLDGIADADAAEEAALDALEADEQRELADLQALKDRPDVELTPEQAQRFDDLTARAQAAAARIQADDDAINAVDPAPAPPAG